MAAEGEEEEGEDGWGCFWDVDPSSDSSADAGGGFEATPPSSPTPRAERRKRGPASVGHRGMNSQRFRAGGFGVCSARL